jgi:hypothetical protein
MKKWVLRFLALAGLLFVATSAHAFPLRSPQVPFNPGPLQGYLNIVDPGINVLTDQLNAQVWTVSVTGNSDFTLTLKNGIGQGNQVGVYNATLAAPPLCQVFPPNAVPGWYSTLNFSGGNLTVNSFDQNSVFLGSVFFPNVSASAFGIYTLGPCGLWYSEDARNGGSPQMLAYQSPSIVGDFWLCWSACHYDPAAGSTFDDVVLNVQSVHPTPAANSTWGSIKGRYR